MRPPKLYREVWIKFWSLRNGVGSNLGVINDIDTEVVRKCRRVLDCGEWKWQLVDYQENIEWDWALDMDKEVLDMNGSELEFKVVSRPARGDQ